MSHGPIYLWQLIYQAKTGPVEFTAPFAETVSVDRWLQPLSLPVPPKPGLHASQQQFQPYNETQQFPETVSEDRWHQPWSEPVRIKPALPAAEQQTLAFDPAVFVASVSGWVSPLSEPAKPKVSVTPAAQQFLAFDPAVYVATPDGWWRQFLDPPKVKPPVPWQQYLAFDPAVFVAAIDGWGSPLSDPPKPKAGLAAASQQFFATSLFFTAAAPPIDSWGAQLSIPQRQLLGLPAGEQQFLAYAEAAPFPETVSEDRWHQPWSDPPKAKTSLPPYEQQALAFVATVAAATPPVDGWATAFADVAKPKPGLPAYQQQALALAEAAPFPETVSEDRWHAPWSEPVRTRLFPTSEQQAVAFDPAVFVASIDGWGSPFAEVPKPKAGTTAACQSFFAFDPQPFPPSVDGWASPWLEPAKPKVSLNVAAQQALAFDPAVFTPSVDGWATAFSDPMRPRPTVTADAIFFPPNFSTTAAPSFGYFMPFAEPQRQLAGLAARLQQFEADGFVPIVPPFVFFFGNQEPLPWPGFRVNQFIRENYDQLAFPPFPIPNPPQTQAKFTVSGPDVRDLFPVSGVVYPYAPETRKTVP